MIGSDIGSKVPYANYAPVWREQAPTELVVCLRGWLRGSDEARGKGSDAGITMLNQG